MKKSKNNIKVFFEEMLRLFYSNILQDIVKKSVESLGKR